MHPCGCTDNSPCPGGFSWDANDHMLDFCSARGAETEAAELRRLVMELGSSALRRKAQVIATRSREPEVAEHHLAHASKTFLGCVVLRLLESALRLEPGDAEAVAAELHELRDDVPDKLNEFLQGHADAMGIDTSAH